ncbi:hypothetical protein [Blastomonas aquatica]|uniref:Uncharacterized protein n=1 Tax=Blastomonas aquatica TaxID=1510276 RepID=A0ABQ1JMA7_9SPHN|nr:hypothetical protein [Blastomonas aquatica]GGB69806.1 hypothetical protein GCM10010833_26310 [Blastomonas aquatica]
MGWKDAGFWVLPLCAVMGDLGWNGDDIEILGNNGYQQSMFDEAPCAKLAIISALSVGLISAAPPPKAPGNGVLCLGTFIYFVEKTGTQCRAGEDPEFQARVASYARRFDDYIVRNSGGDPAALAKFKQSQNLTSEDQDYLCKGDVARSYDIFKANSADALDSAVDELLARDGPPSFGDCV